LAADGLVVGRQNRADVLGVELLRAGGEADEVDEEDADEAPLLLRSSLLGAERGPARKAKPSDVRVVLATCTADGHGQRVRRRPNGAVSRPVAAASDRSRCLAPRRVRFGRADAALQCGRTPWTVAEPPVRAGPCAWHQRSPQPPRAPGFGPVPVPGTR